MLLMEDKNKRGKTNRILVPLDIIKSSGIDTVEFQNHINVLVKLLGNKFKLFVPNVINDINTLQDIVFLSKLLPKLQYCKGFSEHLKIYTKKQFSSNYFLLIVASLLIHKVDSLVFEPTIEGKGKKTDILATLDQENVYLECKQVNTSKFEYSKEHEHMRSILQEYLNVPHQIDIKYRTNFSDEELHKLGKTLKNILDNVTTSGIVINNNKLIVQINVRNTYDNKMVQMTMFGISQDTNENCNYPLHVYFRNGHTLSISGPKIDYQSILREKITRSRCQSPINSPYILVIDGNNMMGSLEENLRALSTAFQPNINTRFSAVLIITYHLDIIKQNFEIKSNIIPNPYAKYPITEKFKSLFY